MLTFDEKQLLAQISDVPNKEAILGRINGLQAQDPDAVAIKGSLKEKIAAMNPREVFNACVEAQLIAVDPEKEQAQVRPTNMDEYNWHIIARILASLTDADETLLYTDLIKNGYSGIVENIETYPSDVREKTKKFIEFLDLYEAHK